jgi:HEAT repeat protein
MRYLRQLCSSRPGRLGLLVLAGLLGSAVTALAQARYPADPVEELRQALNISTAGAETPGTDVLKYRENDLRKHAQALKTLGEMRRALLLTEWRDDSKDDKVAGVDSKIRDEIIARIRAGLSAAFEHGTPAQRIAAADFLADMGTSDQKTLRPPTARSMADLLIKRIHDDHDPAVRAAAARALGKISPVLAPPDMAAANRPVPTLEGLLKKGTDRERRAAAGALLDLVRVVLTQMGTAAGSLATSTELQQIAQAVVPAAGLGLNDPDPSVRETCADAIRECATGYSEPSLLLLVPLRAPADFPPPGRPLTTAERQDIEQYRTQLQDEEKKLRPLTKALSEQTKRLAPLTNDPNPRVRIAALRAVEEVAIGYARIQRRRESVPALPPESKPTPKPTEEKKPTPQSRARTPVILTAWAAEQAADRSDESNLLDGLEAALPELIRALSSPSPATRLAAVEAIEPLFARGAPAVPNLRRALYDRDRFIRWAAARTLGRIGVDHAAVAVPDLARLICDVDIDVRIVAMGVLERFGKASSPAVPALIRAASGGEGTVRVAAIHALEAIGADAEPAIPTLIHALGDNDDARVLRAAAEALARFGSAARAAVPALERLLNDPNIDVRQAASDAILAVSPPPSGK